MRLQGTYNPSPGSPACTNCPAGSSSTTSASSCYQCSQVNNPPASMCRIPPDISAIHISEDGRACTVFDSHVGAIDLSVVLLNNIVCMQGMYSDAPGSVACTSCPAGTSSSATGATSSATCATCGQVGHENITSLRDGGHRAEPS